MEDFGIARINEPNQQTGFQTEWMESLSKIAHNFNDSRLSVTANVKDNQAPEKEKAVVSRKDTTESLDKQLKDFTEIKFADPSRDMQKFQKAVGKFCDAADKEVGFDELGDTWAKINAVSELKAEALFAERKNEAANTPGRKELETDVRQKNNQLSDKILNLPFDESLKITDLMMWQQGETKAQHEDRIRQGLANNKPILDAYNAVGAAEAKVEANKGPREKQLDKLSEQLDFESVIMKGEMEKAYLRSTIKN